jgi:hypothetical protein
LQFKNLISEKKADLQNYRRVIAHIGGKAAEVHNLEAVKLNTDILMDAFRAIIQSFPFLTELYVKDYL